MTFLDFVFERHLLSGLIHLLPTQPTHKTEAIAKKSEKGPSGRSRWIKSKEIRKSSFFAHSDPPNDLRGN
jgi:hypothetical protein